MSNKSSKYTSEELSNAPKNDSIHFKNRYPTLNQNPSGKTKGLNEDINEFIIKQKKNFKRNSKPSLVKNNEKQIDEYLTVTLSSDKAVLPKALVQLATPRDLVTGGDQPNKMRETNALAQRELPCSSVGGSPTH